MNKTPDSPNDNNDDLSNPNFHLTPEGSLGLLAYGDLGLIAWRKVRTTKLVVIKKTTDG